MNETNLGVLWNEYIQADMKVREIEGEILSQNKLFDAAVTKRNEAWEAYLVARINPTT